MQERKSMKNLYFKFLFIMCCNLFCSCELLNNLSAIPVIFEPVKPVESSVLVAVEIPANSPIINQQKEENPLKNDPNEPQKNENFTEKNTEQITISETAKNEEKTMVLTVVSENSTEKNKEQIVVPLVTLESLTQNINKDQASESNKNAETYLPIAGYLEKIWIFGGKNNAVAKLDTGADSCSLDASNIVQFEKDGKKWVKFTIKLGEKSEEKSLPKKRTILIKRHGADSLKRYVVEIDVQLGETRKKVEFTLTDRENFNYPILIGRNFLGNSVLIDSAKTFLLSKED